MDKNVTVAAIQMPLNIGDVKKNIEEACIKIDEVVSKGAQIICLPELFNTGYFCHYDNQNKTYFDLAETLSGTTITSMSKKAKEHDVIIIAPIFDKDGPGVYYNSAVVINEDGSINGVYRKVHLPWSFYAWEKYYFRPGSSYPIFETKYGKIGVMICYDRFFPEVARELALKGAEIIFVPTGAPAAWDDIWKFTLQSRAHENQLFLLAVNSVGIVAPGKHEINGKSILIDPKGSVITELDKKEENLVKSINLIDIDKQRINRTYFRDRLPSTYTTIAKER